MIKIAKGRKKGKEGGGVQFFFKILHSRKKFLVCGWLLGSVMIAIRLLQTVSKNLWMRERLRNAKYERRFMFCYAMQ